MAASPSDCHSDGAWRKPIPERLFGQPTGSSSPPSSYPSRGLIDEEGARRILSLALDLTVHPRIDVISITDNSGGRPMLSAETLGTDMIQRGQDVIIHLACKDHHGGKDPA